VIYIEVHGSSPGSVHILRSNTVKHENFATINFLDLSINKHFAHEKFAIDDVMHCYMASGAKFAAG
jgi:hypothetical protein